MSTKYTSLEDAISAKDLCKETIDERTRYFSVNNKTNWLIEIIFFHGKDESNNIPDGYVADTAPWVGATNVASPIIISSDPCYGGGFHRPIQVTRGNGSVMLINPDNGEPLKINLPDWDTGDMTLYWDHCEWTIDYKRGAAGPLVVAADPILKKKK